MKQWKVLLLRPDYAAATFGHDTYCAHILAETPKEALWEARQDAIKTDGTSVPEDYYCLSCTEGWTRDYSDGDGGVTGPLSCHEALRRLVNFLESDPDRYQGDDDGVFRGLMEDAQRTLNNEEQNEHKLSRA